MRLFGWQISRAKSPPARLVYDNAQTTPANRRHWAGADSLSAEAALSHDVRHKLRTRSRYEHANAPYARAISDTLANFIVGTGPVCQVRDGRLSRDEARAVESEWSRWCEARDFADLLLTARVSQCESGEVFAVLYSAGEDRAVRGVDLAIRLIEADQVSSPLSPVSRPVGQSEIDADGVILDGNGLPVRYRVLRAHPGSTTYPRLATEYDELPAENVIHLFRPTRPGQHRGVPELAPSLNLFATLRRYTDAVLGAAEYAASINGVLKTQSTPEEMRYSAPFSEVEMERGVLVTLPEGYDLSQIRSEQPTTTYENFHGAIVNEAARPVHLPRNLVLANSSGYNFASGKLDHLAFARAVRIERKRIERVVLNRVFRRWYEEARLAGIVPNYGDDSPRVVWMWEGTDPVDPANEANAARTRLESGLSTLAHELASVGMDWEEHLEQLARERDKRDELGLTPAGGREENENEGEDDGSGDDQPQ